MQLVKLELKNFRCFKQYSIDVTQRIVFIEGGNGVGKTSLLEALHYLCYMRSFRAHSPKDLVQFGCETFFIKALFAAKNTLEECEIQVGFSGKKKLVKINQKAIDSYKELLEHYRIITVQEHDLDLIGGGPDQRRAFVDHTLMLEDADFLILSRQIKNIVEQRSALLARPGSHNYDEYLLWTEQLWQKTCEVQKHRREMLHKIEARVQELVCLLATDTNISLVYQSKKDSKRTFQEFLAAYPDLHEQERRMGYTLFGAHLDDMGILLQDRKSKLFASRGQQKLIVLLLKMAQLSVLSLRGVSPLFLLDDFMTDFDEKIAKKLIEMLLGLDNQLIFTAPARGFLGEFLLARGAEHVFLDQV